MNTHRLHISVLFLLLVTSAGCAVYDPVADYTKQRYTNAVSYFNTFYNAQRLFSDAEAEVLKARREHFERNAGGKLPAIPNTARIKFQTSIEKNSKVLSFYPESKWVDDALLMIGMAYYYMDDDVRAERKFQELAVQFPQSDLVLESQLWLGRTVMRQKKYEQGEKLLNDVFTRAADTDDEIAGQSSFELAQYYFEQKEFARAEKLYTTAAGLVDDGELETRIYFQIGRCYTELNQIGKAQQAYSTAQDISPLYTYKFQAQLNIHKLHAAEKRYQEAIEGLQDMLNDAKNSEYLGTIHYELATVMMMSGRTEEALVKFRFIDTAYVRTDEAARSYFTLAKYYEEKELNYDSARVLFGKARTEYSPSEITKAAAERAEIFNKYDQLKKDLHRYDSLLTDLIAARSSADSAILHPRLDTLLNRDTTAVKEEPKIKKMTKPGKASKDSAAAFVAVDSAKIKEKLSRDEAFTKMADSLQRTIARTKFELGGLFFLEIQQPDSAQRWFNEVIATAPKSDFAPRALYTIAEIYRGMLNRPSADLEPLYQRIITEYPESPYANEARKNLSLPVITVEKDSVVTLFEKAEALNESGRYEQAVLSFKRIAEQFPAHLLASKSLLTAGWIYEHSLLNSDSSAALYRRLMARYPLSQYSASVRNKVQEYDNELKRIEQEKQKELEEKKLKEQQEKEAKAKSDKSDKGDKKEKKEETIPVPSDSVGTPKKKL